jgi:hypothetical protein
MIASRHGAEPPTVRAEQSRWSAPLCRRLLESANGNGYAESVLRPFLLIAAIAILRRMWLNAIRDHAEAPVIMASQPPARIP